MSWLEKLRLFVFLMLGSFALPACAYRFTLDIGTAVCLNPPDHYCDDAGSNSRVLEVRIYQLHTMIDPKKLDWQKFVEAGNADLNLVRGVLTDPENPASRTVLVVQRGEERKEQLIRLKGTRFLLVVTLGRHQGDHSVELVHLARGQREERLYFEYYDVNFRLRDRNPALIDPLRM